MVYLLFLFSRLTLDCISTQHLIPTFSLFLGPIVLLCYVLNDTMGRMHSDAQFAGSSSVPAHVEMMGFLGIGNNPMVGCTVACAVDVATALNK